MLDNVPAEAHWNLSHVERCIGWVKEFLTKSSLEKDDREPDQLGTCPVEGRVVLGRQQLKLWEITRQLLLALGENYL